MALEFGIDRIKSGTLVARNGFPRAEFIRASRVGYALRSVANAVLRLHQPQIGVLTISEEMPMKVRVQCYAGHRGEEEPRAFDLSDRRIELMEIIDRWLSPHHRYFRVQAYDGSVYILRHDEAAGEWELTLFRQHP